MLFYKSSSHSAKYVRWCDSCSLATPMQGAELNTARQSSHKSPARDDDVGERPSRHFDRSEAEWRNLPPLMVRAALRREISRLRVSWECFLSAPYRHAAPLEMTMLASAPPVISTEAGQPPIGKPLIVQARGQLRLTWRLYAESPQSGEISFLPWYMKHGGRKSPGSESH